MEEQVQANEGAASAPATLTNAAIQHLRASTPWMKFLSIMGFLLAGIMLIFTIIMLIGSMHAAGLAIVAIIYLIITLLIFLVNMFLYKYASGISDFVISNNPALLERAFSMQKKFWTIKGIMIIAYLVLVVVMMIAAASGSFTMLDMFEQYY